MLIEKIKLEEDEEIRKMIRRHWFIITVEAVGSFFLAFLPVALVFFITSTERFEIFFPFDVPMDVLTFLSALWVLLSWMFFFRIWTNYYLDVWTITNRRIIAIDQKGFFHRSVSSFRYERLQDINIEIKGIIATFLNFGTLQAETAGHGDATDFIFHATSHPRETKAIILSAADALIRDQRDDFTISSGGV